MKPIQKLSYPQLRAKADAIRRDLVNISVKNGAGHIASSLSCVDILCALYYRIMNVYDNPEYDKRDRMVFSKAHGCYGVYAILSDLGWIKRQAWETFYQGSDLTGCLERDPKQGIEAGCGSLGHGLPMAVGLAFAAKLQRKSHRVYCVIGDGEMQEGSNWEAMQFAAKYELSNLTVIVDFNRLQAMDFVDKIMTPGNRKHDLQGKFRSFGFEVKTCSGHDLRQIVSALDKWAYHKHATIKPQALVANTVKGYGLHCMENVPKFHFRIPTHQELLMGNRYERRKS